MKFKVKTLDSTGQVDGTYTLEEDISPRQVEILRERLSEGIEVNGVMYVIDRQSYAINQFGNPSFTVWVTEMGV